MRLALGIDDEETVLSFARARCFDPRQILERKVEQAALAAVLGWEGVGHAGLAHLLGSHLGRHTQFLRAQGLVVASVKADQVVLALLQPEHLGRNGLKSPQQFAIVLGQQGRVWTAQFHIDHPGL